LLNAVPGNKKNTMSERTSLTDIEKKLVRALGQVTFLPASYDKRFYRSLSVDALYTEKQKRYLHFIFNKYRRQISNYQELAFELEPERFEVKIKFERTLFSAEGGQAEIDFKDTFKPSRFVNSNGK
jgi:hypothetical protein